MQCQLCAYEFDATSLACHTHCPLGSRCHLICCPNCGYQVVDESQSKLVRWLEGWMAPKQEPAKAAARSRRVLEEKLAPLSHIPDGMQAEIRLLDELSSQRLARLSVFGLMPGSQVTVLQRKPAPVVRIGETELALSMEILDHIWVRPQSDD